MNKTLPCCGYDNPEAVKWNPHNQVVQCHNCGETYTPQPQQEPVATWENKYGMKEWQVHALRAGWSLPPPQQRQWVGLTDEEVDSLVIMKREGAYLTVIDTIREAEAKLKEKNSG